MSAIIPAKDVGRVILEDLRAFTLKEMPDASEEEREMVLASFLNGMSRAMFKGPTK